MTREEAIKIVRNIYQTDAEKEALGTLIPKLAESEDERIRKTLIHIVKGACDKYGIKYKENEITEEKLLAWLEKQKELFESGRGLYYYDGEKTTYCGYPATEENPYDFAMSQQEKLKEPHYTKRNALFDKCVENCDPEVMKKVSDEVDEMLEKEQKPAEWSEEDEKMINTLVDYVEYPSCWNLKCPREKLVAFIKSLPKRFSPQPKQEWSEEDKRMIDDIISALPKMAEAEDNILPFILPSVARKYAERLKSLRPSWKPSEEQMEALNTLNLHGDLSYVGQQNQLISLYQDLKKLM